MNILQLNENDDVGKYLFFCFYYFGYYILYIIRNIQEI